MKKNLGLTRTERFLGRLANKSFLSLWSYSNLFRDVGKELCDLLVICNDIVIIFSDKEVQFDNNSDLSIAWNRWYNRAITKSVSQLRRAFNWVNRHRERIFLDPQCSIRMELLDKFSGDLEIHLVAIANGASRRCIEYFKGGSGSLVIKPDEPPESPSPFSVGNPGGKDLFVHVFDESNLHIILQELDTIRDFSDYLKSRQNLIQNDSLYSSASEEDLFAVYMKDVNESGRHDFLIRSKPILPGEKIVVEEGAYRSFRNAAPYKRKKKADRQSYFWDHLIEKFANNLTAGTLAKVPEYLGRDGQSGEAEIGLRYMALENRISRRAHSEAILGAFHVLKKSGGNRFFRAMIPKTPDQGNTGFCILLMKRDIMPPGSTYDQYRELRAATLGCYTESLLERNRHLKRVIGLATEGEISSRMSEDMIYHEAPEWTGEAIANAKERARKFDIFTGNLKERAYSSSEYPETDLGLRGSFSPIPYHFLERNLPTGERLRGNRKQRRAAASKKRSRFQ